MAWERGYAGGVWLDSLVVSAEVKNLNLAQNLLPHPRLVHRHNLQERHPQTVNTTTRYSQTLQQLQPSLLLVNTASGEGAGGEGGRP